MGFVKFEKYQYKAKETIAIDIETAFLNNNETALYWLSGAGVLLNINGTILIVDPVLELEAEDPYLSELEAYPLMVLPPIHINEIPKIDGVLLTHVDADHIGPKTLKLLAEKGVTFFGTKYTCEFLHKHVVDKNNSQTISVGEIFEIAGNEIEVTPCYHSYYLDVKDAEHRYEKDDCCGFKITTSDGVIWLPGDSKLLPDHLELSEIDVMMFDICEDLWHFGPSDALKLFNHYGDADKIVYHCGTYYMPDLKCQNGDPTLWCSLMKNPEKLKELAPGEKYVLKKSK